MNVYKISQNVNNGYDTYDAAIVVAKSKKEARNIMPGDYVKWNDLYSSWCQTPDEVEVELIGKATKKIPAGLVLASYNAG
jgi:hypothetical protein